MNKLRPQTPRSTPSDTDEPDSMGGDFRSNILAARVHVDIVIPRTSTAAKMRLISRREEFEVDVDARAALANEGLPIDAAAFGGPGVMQAWTYERSVRLLQKAVRDPKNTNRELATVDDWRECDDDQIATLMLEYRDLGERLHPSAERHKPTSEELETMTAAATSEDVEKLVAFGAVKLARLVLTLSAQRAEP